MENHYCNECKKTQRFLPTGRFVSLFNQRFRIFMCAVCCHDIWVQVRGLILSREVDE